MSAIQDFPGVVVVGVTQKPTRNGSMMYQVALNNGMTPSTFDASVATKAHGLAGQPAVARLEEKPSKTGGRPYLNILDIAPAGQALPEAAAAFGGQQAQAAFGAPAAPAAFGQAQAQPAFGQQQAAPQFPDVSAERDAMTARGYALNSAVTLFAGLFTGAAEGVVGDQARETEFLGQVLRWATAFEHYRKTGRNISEAAVEALATQAAVTPNQVADAVNQAVPGGVQIGAPAVVDAAPDGPDAEAQAEAAEAPTSGIPWKQ